MLLATLSGHAQTVQKPVSAKQSASPSAVRRLGTAAGWSAYIYKEHAGRVCYLAGSPRKSEPARIKRKPPAMMVTHRPEENVANVVSFVEGYRLKDGSDASLEVDTVKFDLFTKGDTAWARTADIDKAIVEAMAKGKQAVIKAIPQKGPPTTDTYSLTGFPRALALIDKACDVKR